MSDDFSMDAAGVIVDGNGASEMEMGRDGIIWPDEPQAASGFVADPAVGIIDRALAKNSASKKTLPLYFDIETIPDYDRMDSFGLEPLPPVPREMSASELPDLNAVRAGTIDDLKRALRKLVAPVGWLDELAAAERADKGRAGALDAIEAAKKTVQSVIDQHADRLKLLSTVPEFCKVAALGLASGNNEVVSLVLGIDGITELDILEAFWEFVSDCSPLVGYNCLAFDLPVILTRSALLGVLPTKLLSLSPYGNKDVFDLYIMRFGRQGNTDKQRPAKMKVLARVLGIDVSAGDCDGSQVDALMKETPEKVGQYVASDVCVLRSLHAKLKGYWWV